MSSSASTTTATVTGSCACGKITFATDDEPGKLFYCYCTTCRKISGAEYLPFVQFRKDQIQWNQEPDEFQKTDRATRTHCANCGSSLTMAYHDDPHEIWIIMGSFDKGFERVRSVVRCIYVKEAPSWAHFPAGIPKSDEMS